MLSRLEIRDFALIEQAVLEPEAGLMIISGETGAGKSILIDAIGSLKGGRLSKDMIRYGQKRAVIEALFSNIEHCMPHSWRQELAIEDDEDLILSREINQQGKSICRINGRLVNQSVLRQTAGWLIDIHGQNDQQTIFKTDTHLQLLDRFGGKAIKTAKADFKTKQEKCIKLRQELLELGADPAQRARQIDLLTYQINELETAAVQKGEEEKLQKRRKMLSGLERIEQSLEGALSLLSGDSDDGISAQLALAIDYLEFPARYIDDADNCKNELNSIQDQLATHTADIRSWIEKYQAKPDELEKTENRLDLFYRLKKKYGSSMEDVIEYEKKAKAKLEKLSMGEAKFEQLRKLLDEALQELARSAVKLYDVRCKTAEELKAGITSQLLDLGMKGVSFSVAIKHFEPEEDHLGKNNLDQVEFMISANPGEPLKPLVKIASGGEASRVLLAIKTILADADDIPVLIFDEIDTGVSGQTAGMVADKLKQIAKKRQVLCITHMAQIAAKADQHILIEKSSDDVSTRTNLQILDRAGRLGEVARLLSGGVADNKARELAAQMLN